MQFFKHFWLGISAYWDALKFIHQKRWYWYILIPAALMLVIYKLGDMLRTHSVLPNFDTMNGIVWYAIQLMIEISIALLLMKFAKYLVVIILSPLLSYLSQKCEKELTGNRYPFKMHLLVDDVKRGIKIAVRNIMWEYFFFLIIFIVSKFGWEDPRESPVFYLTFFIGFFYYGFSFIDYVNERRRLEVDESIVFMRKHRGLAIAIGAIYSVLILVPVDLSSLFSAHQIFDNPVTGIPTFLLHLFLWICASVAPILAIVAATISMHKLVDLSKNSHSIKNSE